MIRNVIRIIFHWLPFANNYVRRRWYLFVITGVKKNTWRLLNGLFQ